ncbi:MAG: bifunctional methylenetetrahydrofolate dehydrogenase/methenyltetrahydrofolate cyclohydrolase FolD [Candidatus Kapabacteria bacterium]|nr:bifunctional methylenetetrahydrofolate dehydrogenase/methenyltetrahydrofolate cyclohydrolase FolD [Candidatus Kapabacteria bacterium]
MALVIDGKAIAAEVRNEIKIKVSERIAAGKRTPGLAILLVGDDPASQSYVGGKGKACAELGVYSVIERRPENTSEEEVLSIINEWNRTPEIDGILVQLPLPKHIDENKVILSISPDKDVDGFHPQSFGRLVIGIPGFVPCTPAGIVELLVRSQIPLKGKHVVVLGRSNIVGKPIANLLYQKNPRANAVVTICHTAAPDFRVYTRQADILIAAAGVPLLIKADDVKEGVTVIDVGINRVDDPSASKGYKIVGDVDYESVFPKAYAITPVPGGVGPMTIAMLLNNTLKSIEMSENQ